MASKSTLLVIATIAGLGLPSMDGAGAVAREPSPTDSAPGRTLHVAPESLPDIAADMQFRTISEVAKVVAPGDTVLVHSGIYRESVRVESSGTKDQPIRFEAAPSARVIISGADLITTWKRVGEKGENVFRTNWPHRFIGWSKTLTHPDDDHHLLIGRAEQVFVAGYPLRQVLKRERLERGTFFVDLENKQMDVWGAANEDLKQARVEASVRPQVWDGRGDYVHIRSIHFQYAANAAQQAAVQFHGRGDVVEDCVFEEANSIGAGFLGPEQVVRRCLFQENGQMGWAASHAHGLLMTDCVTIRNNTKNFDRGWEAGGNKVVLSRDVVIEHSRFERNHGNGIWFDIGNERPTVRNCLIASNDDAGVFFEISFGLHALDNVIVENGFAETPGAWGASAGICLSSSPDCVIERNLLVANKEGFAFREQARTTPRIDARRGDHGEEAVWVHDEVIRNNIFSSNRDAQVWGWFDTDDERHWPATMQEKPHRSEAALSLEKLHLTIADNVYAPGPGQPLFRWGTVWRRNRSYTALDAVRAELGLEAKSVVVPITWENEFARDFRVRSEAPAALLEASPRDDVPGVRLGTMGPAKSMEAAPGDKR